MKKVGIIVDNYKLRKFKRALDREGFTFETKPFTPGTTGIFIEVEAMKVPDIARICNKLEIDFKHSN